MPSLRFIKLANVFEQLERTTSGNKMREILARFFKTVPKKEIDIIAYLLLGQIASKYEDINIGMAEKMVLRSIAIDSGRAEKEVSSTFKKLGDVGLTAEKLTTKSKPTLTVAQVFNTLHKIAAASGPGSQEFKIKPLAALLKKASPKEARYIARIILGT
ncbi:DNA ligase, partial [Candidatus Woesearchaeota archaeon]|nr:DNA ligase [Candidatus Woesearchaeota archaeon]